MAGLNSLIWVYGLFILTIVTGFGWACFDGRKRVSKRYRSRITNRLDNMPDISRDRFFVLFLPQKFSERLAQALIIGLCTVIVMIPFWFVFGCWLGRWPLHSLLFTAIGGILGAVLGEFILNNSAAKVDKDITSSPDTQV